MIEKFSLKEMGIKSFKTKAVEQTVLDCYVKQKQGNIDNFLAKKIHLLTHMSNTDRVKRFRTKSNQGYEIYMLNLAPHESSKYKNICLYAENCMQICIGEPKSGNDARLKMIRTVLYFQDNEKFMTRLKEEIQEINKNRGNKNIAIRLNGYSDIEWEKTGIFTDFKNIQFYDYTKYPNRYKNEDLPENYHLTYSYDIGNAPKSSHSLKKIDMNIAVIVDIATKESILSSSIDTKYKYKNRYFTLIDGDEYDCRFLDKKTVDSEKIIILLKFQGGYGDCSDIKDYAICSETSFQNDILEKI